MDDEDYASVGATAEDELSLPKGIPQAFCFTLATVTKLIQDLLPPDIAIAKESLNLIIECCVEFIQLVASESNEICECETKKTIIPEHIQTALSVCKFCFLLMQNLGFNEYLEDVDVVIEELRQNAKTKEKRTNKLEESGLTEEEFQKQQEELFQLAKQRYQETLSTSGLSPDSSESFEKEKSS